MEDFAENLKKEIFGSKEKYNEATKVLEKDKIEVTEKMLIAASAKAVTSDELLCHVFSGVHLLAIPILIGKIWDGLKEEADGTEKD